MQIWYAALLTTIVAALVAFVYLRAADETSRRINAQLETSALLVDASLRGRPPHEIGPVPQDFDKKWKPPFKRRDPRGDIELPREMKERGGYFAVWRGDGEVVVADGLGGPIRPATSVDVETLDGTPRILGRGDYREAWIAGPVGTTIVVGRSIRPDFDQLHRFGGLLLLLGLSAIAFGVAGGWVIAGRIVRPIEAMSRAAESISGDDLSARIDARSIDAELSGLAAVLNDMFDRLESAFRRQQQFTADASHELRTPLSIIRSQTELALSKSRTPEEYRQTLETCHKAAQRMSNLVQGLLTLARVDAGKAFSLQNVRLHDLVADHVASLRPLAEAKRIQLTCETTPIEVSANGQRLGQVVLNLVSNAIAFTQEGGRVEVRLAVDDDFAVLTVRDNGPGIPARDCPKIFQRFFRVDKSRARAVGGTGLGLAICKTLVESHHGVIDFETQEGVGTTFRVRIPKKPPIDSALKSRRDVT